MNDVYEKRTSKLPLLFFRSDTRSEAKEIQQPRAKTDENLE